MQKRLQPMKAPSQSLLDSEIHTLVRYPCIVSPKYDGIRCLIHPELGPVTQSLKPIPNDFIQYNLDLKELEGLDGELVTLDDDGNIKDFTEISGDVRRQRGEPSFKFMVFDCFLRPSDPFSARIKEAAAHVLKSEGNHAVTVSQPVCESPDEVLQYYQKLVAQGWEGIMIRDPSGPYKVGRSTKKQGWLLKYKPWDDAEGVIVGVEPLMKNANEKERDVFGHAKRSSHKEGKVRMELAGKLVLKTKKWGEVKVGVQSAKDRDELWHTQDEIIGLQCTFKYQKHGSKDKPRFPIFKAIRYPE